MPEGAGKAALSLTAPFDPRPLLMLEPDTDRPVVARLAPPAMGLPSARHPGIAT